MLRSTKQNPRKRFSASERNAALVRKMLKPEKLLYVPKDETTTMMSSVRMHSLKPNNPVRIIAEEYDKLLCEDRKCVVGRGFRRRIDKAIGMLDAIIVSNEEALESLLRDQRQLRTRVTADSIKLESSIKRDVDGFIGAKKYKECAIAEHTEKEEETDISAKEVPATVTPLKTPKHHFDARQHFNIKNHPRHYDTFIQWHRLNICLAEIQKEGFDGDSKLASKNKNVWIQIGTEEVEVECTGCGDDVEAKKNQFLL